MFKAIAAVWFWLTNPVTNSRNNALSLGRASLCGMLILQAWFILRHPKEFVQLGWPPALVLCMLNLFLLVYCFGDKPWIRDLGQTVAQRFSFGNGAVSTLAASATATAEVTAQAPAVPAPAAPEEALPADMGPEEGAG